MSANNKKTSLLIIFGGASPEHEVSCSSAAGIVEFVDREKYDVSVLGVTKDGRWIHTSAPAEAIRDSTSWLTHPDNTKGIVSPDRDDHGILIFEKDGSIRKVYIDVVFPIILGENGEDGTLQGLLEIAGLPYVGSGVCASACSMDKLVTRIFADNAKLRQPGCLIIEREEFKKDSEKVMDEIEKYFGTYPVIVKPSMTGSSIGITKAENRKELFESISLAALYKGRLMIEEYITGTEIKVAVLEDDGIKTGAICEMKIPKGCFNDYNMKYKSSGSHKTIPAELDPETEKEIREASVKIFEELGCEGYARVDFFLTADKVLYFNEINTVPGFSERSIFPVMFDKAGLPYPEMITRMIEKAKA